LEREAANIAEAIAANGHRESPTLLARLAVTENQIERVKNRLLRATIANETPISLKALKDFVAKKASDLQTILSSDPQLAKDALRKHITKLVLTPRRTLNGPVFDVSGDVKLFAGESNVMLMVPGTGDERFCAFRVGHDVLLLFKEGESKKLMELEGGIIPPHDTLGAGHFAFAISPNTLEEWRSFLREQGVPIESEVRWQRGGTSLYFRDPDNNLVELATPGIWPNF